MSGFGKLHPGSCALLIAATISLTGCAITINEPANSAFIVIDSNHPKVHVAIMADADIATLQVTADGTNVTSQMVAKSSREQDADLTLEHGSHTITANAQLGCWYCLGRTTPSSATSTFSVVIRHK